MPAEANGYGHAKRIKASVREGSWVLVSKIMSTQRRDIRWTPFTSLFHDFMIRVYRRDV